MLEKNALALQAKGAHILELLKDVQSTNNVPAQEAYIKPKVKREDVLVLIGFGRGDFAKKLIEDFPKNTIVCYESNLEQLKATLNSIDISSIAECKNFLLIPDKIDTIENTIKTTFNLFTGKFTFGDLIILTNPNTNENDVKIINDILNKLYTPILLNRNTMILKSREIVNNMVRNVSDIAFGKNLDYLNRLNANHPCVVVASGPSLSNDIQTLKEIQSKVLIIAVDSTIPILQKEQIKPDIICGLDYQYVTLEKYSNLMKETTYNETLFVFEPAIFYQIPKLFKYKVFKTEGNSFLDLLGIKPKYATLPINAVTHLAMNVAYILCSNPIVLVGQDWAYTKAAHHAQGTILTQGLPENLRWVKGNYEEMVPTDDNLFAGLTIMSEIAKFLTSRGIEVINAASGGAEIENTKLDKLSNIAKKFTKPKTPLRWQQRNLVQLQYKNLNKFIKKMKDIDARLNKAILMAEKALSINAKIQKIYAKTHDIEKIRTHVDLSNKINNELYINPVLTHFVFFYYFKEFYDYFKEESDIEDQAIEKRIEQSNKYFEMIKTYAANLKPLIEETIEYLTLKNKFLTIIEPQSGNISTSRVKDPSVVLLHQDDWLYKLLMACAKIGDVFFALEILKNFDIQTNAKLLCAKAKVLSNYRFFHKQVLELYEKALTIDPDFEEAKTALEIEKYKVISHLVLARDSILNQNDFITAKRLVERALDYDPSNPQVLEWLDKIKGFENIQVKQQQQNVLREQLKIEGTLLKYDKAIELIKQNKLDEAYEQLKNLNKKYPNFGDVLFLMGSILIDKKEHDKALEYLEQARQLLPYHPFVHIALSKVYMSKEIYDKAKDALENALNLNPNLIYEIGENLGDLYYEFAQYTLALAIYEKNIQTTPDKVKLLMKIALCYKGLGLIESYNQITNKLSELSTNA